MTLRLEDKGSNELFAACPVEQVKDRLFCLNIQLFMVLKNGATFLVQ
jgi:hypothetical protein